MLCRGVVNSALRKLGRLGSGREPRVADQTDVFGALQGAYASLIASGTFGRIYDVAPLGVNFVADQAWHVYRESDATLTVDLPETRSRDLDYLEGYGDPYSYGSRWIPPAYSANVGGRAPRDCTVVRITNDHPGITGDPRGITRDFMFDGDYRAWVSIDDLTLDDEAPLSRRNGDGLAAYVATRVADEFGAEVGAATGLLATQFINQLAVGYARPATTVYAEYF